MANEFFQPDQESMALAKKLTSVLMQDTGSENFERPFDSRHAQAYASEIGVEAPVTVTVSGIEVHFERIPDHLVVFHNGLGEARKTKFSEKMSVNPSFIKVPQPIEQSGGYIAYIAADAKDMKECAEFVRVQLNEAEPGLGTSLPIREIQPNQRPQSPEGTNTERTIWIYLP